MDMNLHLISDSTGAAVVEVARGCMAQFPEISFNEHNWFMIRSNKDIEKVSIALRQFPGVIIISIVDTEHKKAIREVCEDQDLPCISVIDGAIEAIERFGGVASSHKAGGKYKMDEEYFSRIEAMDFTIAHDDAQSLASAHKGDIIILGVSRTSKTPTSIYLAHKGYKVANIPILKDYIIPQGLDLKNTPFIVGLIIDPKRLVSVRQNRSINLYSGQKLMGIMGNKDYINFQTIYDEVETARKFFQKQGYPIIDVTFRSIEETAAEIIRLYEKDQRKREQE